MNSLMERPLATDWCPYISNSQLSISPKCICLFLLFGLSSSPLGRLLYILQDLIQFAPSDPRINLVFLL
jgi:hypothetical protein